MRSSEELKEQMKLLSTGANCHTVNKAGFYLDRLSRKPEKLAPLVACIERFLVSKDAKELREFMLKWW